MKKKKIFIMAAMALSLNISAQDFSFDEMTYSPKQTTFKLFAPTAKKVSLLYGDEQKAKMKKAKDGVWICTLKGDQKDKPYMFSVDGRESVGVFAKAVGVNGTFASVVDMAETNPAGWENDVRPALKSPADLVIYEMHHRDVSISRKDAKYPGKFLALTEDWAINHLKDLGVNAIHILPSFDYASVDETKLDQPQFNWGYDPVNYNVPDGSYSTDPYDPKTRIREFKQMVQALHKAGIRVILDVVYNHTFNIENSNFQKTCPDYYYRKTADGKFSDGSGCGNETASEQPMMRRFMIESVKYWANEYHIDGFRFDLMGIHDIETMNEIRAELTKIDPTLFIYGEGWSAGTCAYPQDKLAMKANAKKYPGIAAFSDEMRDALRGPFSDDTKGAFLAGLSGEEESIKAGIAGMIAHPQVDYSKVNYTKEPWALQPTQMISYVSCHDDMCLVDRLKASVKGIGEDELIRLVQLAQTTVFTSQGVPFMLSGEELLRDKKGVHNSYNSPDEINQFDWSNKDRYPQVFEYYKNLIALRKHHPAFRLGDAELVRKHLEFLPTQDNIVAFRLKDNAGGDSWKDIIVVLNGSDAARKVDIPQGKYTVVCFSGKIDERGFATIEGSEAIVNPQSALIMHN